jgi:hypothetical protein
MNILPDTPVALLPAAQRISVGRPVPVITAEDKKVLQNDQEDKARYKIEVMFHRNRSSLLHKPTAVMLLIWESGKRLHGGGDEKMYWCGYLDCGKPISSDDFGYMHLVCRHCQREQFLDPSSKHQHLKSLRQERRTSDGIEKLPFVVGERLANLTPSNLASFLEKTWYQLNSEADVYFKYSPYEIRYDILQESTRDIDNLEKVRVQRKPGIYTLAAIRKDIANGANLKSRFLAMITA